MSLANEHWERVRAWQGWQQRRPPRGLAGAVFWLAVWLGVLSLLRFLPGSAGTMAAVLQVMVGLSLLVVAAPLLARLVRRHMLWSLRNKLVLTYLLIGLAPVVLFVTLVLVSGYIAAGQFAIHLADTRLESEMDQLAGLNAVDSGLLMTQVVGAAAHLERPVLAAAPPEALLRPKLGAFMDGNAVPLDGGEAAQRADRRTPLGLPPWASRMESGRFRGLVLDVGELYLVAIRQRALADGRRFSLISSVPVDRELMYRVARGLGRAELIGVMTGNKQADALAEAEAEAANRRSGRALKGGAGNARTQGPKSLNQEQIRRSSVVGGNEPEAANPLDLRVRFLSTIPAMDWDTGSIDNVPIEVVSRPSRLYPALFGASLEGVVTRVLRIGLIVLCVLFALIEALALWMAVRLSKTVTASVTDLYDATQRIDRGEFGHRIGVTRDDQMAELSRSFNTMTGSLQRLMKEQKEKERLQSEILIAQEVQANLFPQTVTSLPMLELHGVCRPARAVSGDYYDFLLFGDEGRPPTGVGIALGDISGKGISAALLMATLHSAVRAYRLASEELLLDGQASYGELRLREMRAKGSMELFESPGRILSLLNRHLYRSTQPEKYATLFLAHYDAGSARLTYSNAGQLPPLVLGADDSVRRLDCGGTVVGLMDGMEYEQETIVMHTGDIMVAYSDGVTEPENDFGDFGEERMMEVVRRYRHQPLHVISAQVMQALDAWIGAEEQPDDITLVLARQM